MAAFGTVTRPRLARPISDATDIVALGEEAILFSEMRLSDPILRGLADAGFERPSAIQARAIPIGRMGVDMIAQAKSGTGKTVVFAALALELMRPNQPAPQALIVVPTREIALQCCEVCRIIGTHLRGISCHAFVGGTALRTDRAAAARAHLATGTPGRLVDLLLSEALIARHVRLLVLDEADKLCGDAGFEEQLRYLLTCLPERRQTLAFSATYPAPLLATLQAAMRSPHRISLLPALAPAADESDPRDPLGLLDRPLCFGGKTAERKGTAGGSAADGATPSSVPTVPPELVGSAALASVRQYYRVVGRGGSHEQEDCKRQSPSEALATARRAEVLELLERISFHQALVFCNRPEEGSRLARELAARGFPSAFISGALAHEERLATMRRMHAFELRVLVATDLLARGVDFGRVTLVTHLGLPRDLPTYLHRVGRTGRFGARGLSVLLLAEAEVPAAQRMLTPLRAPVRALPVALDEVDEYLEREVDHLEREVDHLEREDEHLEREDKAIEEQQVALGATRLDAARSAETAAAAAAAAAPDRSRQRKPSNDRPPEASTPRSSQGTVQNETLGGAHAEMGDKACRNGVCVASNLCEPSRSTHCHLKELERARARGRQRGLEEARRKAREQFGLDACSAHQWLA
jgi:superfamily II DNA/RNA helicase